MPAPLTVVIPTLNAERQLSGAAASLIEGLDAGLVRELVVSDGGSTDETAAVADALGARVVSGPPGRGGQLARGVKEARGEWILLLHADTWLSDGWSEAARRHMERQPDRAGYFRLAFRSDGIAPEIVAAWANLRSRLFGLPYGDQGFLVSAQALAEAGGVPDIPLMEDVALARAFRGRLTPLSATAVTSDEKYRSQGWLTRGGANLVTLLRYFGGASPDTLARTYRRGQSPEN